MIGDALGEKPAELASTILLGPFYLLGEIYGSLLPGILFFALLLEKGNHTALSLLHATSVGYGTKICGMLILCFLLGKIFALPSLVLPERYTSLFPHDQSLSKERQVANTFFGGAIALPLLFGKFRGMDIMVAGHADLVFHYTTGVSLIVSSALPGDGYLRILELVIGLAMMTAAWRKKLAMQNVFIALLGASSPEWATTIPDAIKGVQAVAGLFGHAKSPGPTSEPAQGPSQGTK
ncbi:MAG: hypothetical protein LAP13_13505 [Acidobacteriia bacterium]|nr:hypothetical protein [Terriglobia bacterium]